MIQANMTVMQPVEQADKANRSMTHRGNAA